MLAIYTHTQYIDSRYHFLAFLLVIYMTKRKLGILPIQIKGAHPPIGYPLIELTLWTQRSNKLTHCLLPPLATPQTRP